MQGSYGTTIHINNPTEGAEINFTGVSPNKIYTVQGRATPTPPETSVTTMGWSINNDPVRMFSPNLMGNYDPFQFDITEADCAVGQWHVLAVHAWGNLGDHSVETRSFKRLS